MLYCLPISPSPNFKTEQSIPLYPISCFFDETKLNYDCGTDFQLTIVGSPVYKKESFHLFMNEVCYGSIEKLAVVDMFRKEIENNVSDGEYICPISRLIFHPFQTL